MMLMTLRSATLALGLLLTLTSWTSATPQSGVFPLGPDALPQPGVPAGTITHHELLESVVFPGTVRRYSVYVPAQYRPGVPAALMIFQDGHAYLAEAGPMRVPFVFDNLIHRGEMPVTIGVFVDPGHLKDALPETRGWQPAPENRSFEYDSLGPAYSEFLLQDLLPKVEATHSISQDPALRAIGGVSSGGICAFTAAWERPDKFGKILSHVGSFTNIRHGDTYPGIIRKADKKPIRVYLQDGSNDLNNKHGNWWLANLQMDSALRFKEYDVRFDRSLGGHGGEHGGALLADALRWLWRDVPGVTPKLAIMPEIQDASWALDWWIPRHEAKIAQRKAMERVDLLMIGDSITHGWEDAGKPVWDEYYAERNALNLGFGGDRTEHVIWRLQNGAVDDIQPKLAVLMIGTNNAGHREEDAAHTAAGIQRIIAELRLRLPGTKVLLLGIFPRGATPEDPLRKINDDVNEMISSYADDEAVWYLDLAPEFLTTDGQLPMAIMSDLLHPGLEGYSRWAKAMEPTLGRLLE